ncbi:MAG TPA: DUF1428 domain-containing protein [Pyrinomonadaceae bacterium]|jgi:uncharacterized protein YbaA (DUF1428 family)
MAKYVDGFVIPVPKENVERYREMAQRAGDIWKEYGALQYIEAVGDDLEAENMLSFKTIAGAANDETVIFAWIVYESREERDRINAAVMEDSRLKEDMEANKNVFDFKRMAYGGFRTLVDLS